MADFILNIDNAILDFIQLHIVNDFLNPIMLFITGLGDAGIIWIAITLLLLLSQKYRRYGIILALSLIFANLLGNDIIKPIVQRIRPCNVNTEVPLLLKRPRNYSFPSGHTISSFAAAAAIMFANRTWGYAAYLIASLIGFSRLYLYVHYPSDVLAGIVLGTLVALFVIASTKNMFQKQAKIINSGNNKESK